VVVDSRETPKSIGRGVVGCSKRMCKKRKMFGVRRVPGWGDGIFRRLVSRRRALEPFFCFGSANVRVTIRSGLRICDPMLVTDCNSLRGRTQTHRASEQKPGNQLLAETASLGFCATPAPRIGRRSFASLAFQIYRAEVTGARRAGGTGAGGKSWTLECMTTQVPGKSRSTLQRVTCSGLPAWLAPVRFSQTRPSVHGSEESERFQQRQTIGRLNSKAAAPSTLLIR
jgi:hypothetical protein